jgi:hypothetical protein
VRSPATTTDLQTASIAPDPAGDEWTQTRPCRRDDDQRRAAGLLVGIAASALGIAVGTGLVAYVVAATIAHIRVNDYQLDHLFPALLMLAVSVDALTLAALSV